ncbi:MAG TPA: phosphatase PAP2 family protein [Usitatibacter sp.]|jgi:undecaprenyl-diphosphatase|nr:phosphatase PAP2 family protein [Usitatibacter sp.]
MAARARLAARVSFGLAAAAFAALAWSIAVDSWTVPMDEACVMWLHSHMSGGGTAAMALVSRLHSPGMIGLWSLAFAAILVARRERQWIATLALAVVGGMLLNDALKLAFHRARPHFEDSLDVLGSYSFPSGHTADSTVFYGALAAYLFTRFPHRGARAAIATGAILAIVAVACSRVYLGAHYPSDVIAAACTSTMWLVLCLNRR